MLQPTHCGINKIFGALRDLPLSEEPECGRGYEATTCRSSTYSVQVSLTCRCKRLILPGGLLHPERICYFYTCEALYRSKDWYQPSIPTALYHLGNTHAGPNLNLLLCSYRGTL